MNASKITIGTLSATLALVAGILLNLEKIDAWMPPTKSDLQSLEERLRADMQKGQADDAAKRRALGWHIGRNWEGVLLLQGKPTGEADLHRYNRQIRRIQAFMDKLEDDKAARTFIEEFRK